MANLITKYFDSYDFTDVNTYLKLGGFMGLRKAIEIGPEKTIDALKVADLKGRGGAEFPAWKKWTSSRNKQGEKIILCNADEGEPGSFKDRDILFKDPMKVIEGMLIGAYVIGAEQGYIYIREEYGHIKERFDLACQKVLEAGYLGRDILGTGFNFNIQINTGAGAYICGENSALIESMHGKAGRPRLKPPRVGEKGLFDLPTMVNNVETFVCAATVMIEGIDIYTQTGTKNSVGNKVLSMSGNIKRPGTYEIPFGLPLKDLLYDIGGGTKNGSQIKFVQSGGASGALIPSQFFDMPFTYEDFEKNGFSIGAGSIVVVDEHMSIVEYLLAIEEFFHHESCGKCTPCREGTKRLVTILKHIKNQTVTLKEMENLRSISEVMVDTSFCGLGITAPTAIFSALKYYEEELYKIGGLDGYN